MLNVVLFEPEIPQNTGNIGRLCVCNGLKLHLVKPLGFDISDKQVKRSGLDYWEFLDLQIHESWQDLQNCLKAHQFWYLSSKSTKTIWQAEFKENDVLVFGPETRGLPDSVKEEDKSLLIPMFSAEHKRSLNLSTSAGIVVYEALRQVVGG